MTQEIKHATAYCENCKERTIQIDNTTKLICECGYHNELTNVVKYYDEKGKIKAFPFNGYAPGNYMNTCACCKKDIYNVDKLCFVCLECAVMATKETDIDKIRRFVDFVVKLEATFVNSNIAQFWYVKGRSDTPTNDEFIIEFLNSEHEKDNRSEKSNTVK